ncbi:MAG TPA: hypothetical protein VGC29_01310 [Flavisolibacter sp.]
MKITATILLSIFSILSVCAQTSAPVYGIQKLENTDPVHRALTDKSSADQYIKPEGKENQVELAQMIREHHFTRHIYFAVLFFQGLEKHDARAMNKMDYYRGKSLKFK